MTFALTFEIPELSIPYLGPVLDAQTAVNVLWLRSTSRLPGELYTLFPRVFYYEDPHHGWRCPRGSLPADSDCATERFGTIPRVLERGYADCKCLSAWRAAELRVRYGLPARAVAIPASMPDLIHVVVDRGDGQEEDPSRIMGMGAFFEAKRSGRLSEFFRERMNVRSTLGA